MNAHIDFKVAAVLPAGGVGQRTGLEVPKQFAKVGGKPLICYALDTFQSIPWISIVSIPVAAAWRVFMENIIKSEGYTKVILSDGKDTRHQSIYEGIKSLSKSKPDVVIIQDAVRPLVEEATLYSVAIAARQFGASGAVRPLVSTILMVNEKSILQHSLVRSQCRASEMPQAFQYDIIKTAYSKATENDFLYGTECLQLALEYTGTKAKLIEGPSNLWKVTYQSDLDALERILSERDKRDLLVCNCTESPSNFISNILDNLKSACCKLRTIASFHSISSLQQTHVVTNEAAKKTSKRIALVFIDDFSDGSNIAQLRSLCEANELTVVLLICSASEIVGTIKEFLRQCREDTAMKSTISCVVYSKNNEVSQIKANTSRKITDLLKCLIEYECKSFHGQIFEF